MLLQQLKDQPGAALLQLIQLALRDSLSEGVVGIPAGLPGMAFAFVAATASVSTGGQS